MKRLGFLLALLLSCGFLPAQRVHVWVDAVKGSDTNPGTRAKPMKSITKAVTTYNRNAVIHLLPGVYGPKTTGDFWNAATKKAVALKMTDYKNFTLMGEDRDKCVVDFGFTQTTPSVPFYGLILVTGPATDNVTICNLTFKNNRPKGPWGAGAVQTYGPVKHVNVHHCVFDNIISPIIFWGGFDCTIHDNLFLNSNVALRTRIRYFAKTNGDRLYVYNNVYYKCGQGIGIGNGNGNKNIPPPTQFIVNNVALACGNGFIGGGNIHVPALIFENNLAYQCTTKNFAMAWVPSKSNLSLDPLFVDPAKGDFRLKAKSPCVDAGYHGIAAATKSYAFPDMANDFFGDCRMSDGDMNGSAVTDIGLQEVNAAHLSVSNFAQGQTAVWSLTRTIPYPFTAVFLLTFRKGALAFDPIGLVSVDTTSLLFSTVVAAPGKVNLPVPKNPVLTGAAVHVQALGFRTTPQGFRFLPTGRVTSYL